MLCWCAWAHIPTSSRAPSTYKEKVTPIGRMFTASLANLVIKMWDCKFTELAWRTGIHIKLFVRYVDDCRVFLNGVKRGWIWKDGTVVFSQKEYEDDEDSRQNTIKRRTRLITGMVCSLAINLKFTCEDCTQFEDNTLPILDTALWVEQGKVQYRNLTKLYLKRFMFMNEINCTEI